MLRLGILGYPLSHSLSPVFQTLFIQSCGLQGTYDCFEVPPEALHFWMASTHSVTGFNVTIPHKVTVMSYCQSVSEVAQQVGAVNTLCVTPQGFVGHNTDVSGFLAPLAGMDLHGRTAMVLGAGGACRAVAVGLTQQGIARIVFVVRDVEKAQVNLASLLPYLQHLECEFVTRPSEQVLASVNLLVNTTPLGMYPNVKASPLSAHSLAQLPAEALVYDLVYNPLETQLILDARALGLQTQDGLDMLIAQGAASFKIWTGEDISQDTLHTARNVVLDTLKLR